MIIFLAHKVNGPTDKSHTVDMHLNYAFQVNSIMSHNHDVINTEAKESDQKMKSEDFLHVINNF